MRLFINRDYLQVYSRPVRVLSLGFFLFVLKLEASKFTVGGVYEQDVQNKA